MLAPTRIVSSSSTTTKRSPKLRTKDTFCCPVGGKHERNNHTKGRKVKFHTGFRIFYIFFGLFLNLNIIYGQAESIAAIGSSSTAKLYDQYAEMNYRIGEASHPGPKHTYPTPGSPITVEVGNVTYLINARHIIKERTFDYFFGQEHSITKADWARSRQELKPGSLHLSELDPEAETPLGGLCALRRDRRQNITPKPKSKNFEQINGKGRVQLYAIDFSFTVFLLVYNFYGWTNTAKDKEAAGRTNAMMEWILEDIELQPAGPVMIVGDINGNLSDFKALQEAVQRGSLLDVGAHAQRWGRTPNDYTCKAPGAKQPSRRDYILANAEAYELIEDFEVDHNSHLLVHDILTMKLNVPSPTKKTRTLIKPRPLNDLLVEVLGTRHRQEQAEATEETKQKSKGAGETQGQRERAQPPDDCMDPFEKL